MKSMLKCLSVFLSFALIAACLFCNTAVFADQSDIFIYRVEGDVSVLTGLDSAASGDITVPATLGGKKVVMVDGAFSFKNKVTSVVLPDDIEVITKESFTYCTGLKSVKLPDNLKKIGEAAFAGCTSLTEVVMPDSVTEAGEYAFAWCEKMTSVTLSENLTWISKGAFNGGLSLADISVPEKVTYVGQDAFVDTAYCSNESNWDNNVLYIGKHLFKARSGLSGRYEVRSDTKSITDNAFSGCTMLKELVIHLPTKRVGESICLNCRNLTDVYYEGDVSDRRRINVGKSNYSFTDKPTWHYEYDPDVKEYAPGDINGDDLINNKDALRLFKYLSDWGVEAKESVLDVNADKSVNNKDLTRLIQYLSGWDVAIYSKPTDPQ